MKRVRHLFVPSLTGCLLVASLLSSCTGIHGPMSVPSAGELATRRLGRRISANHPCASWRGFLVREVFSWAAYGQR